MKRYFFIIRIFAFLSFFSWASLSLAYNSMEPPLALTVDSTKQGVLLRSPLTLAFGLSMRDRNIETLSVEIYAINSVSATDELKKTNAILMSEKFIVKSLQKLPIKFRVSVLENGAFIISAKAEVKYRNGTIVPLDADISILSEGGKVWTASGDSINSAAVNMLAISQGIAVDEDGVKKAMPLLDSKFPAKSERFMKAYDQWIFRRYGFLPEPIE